MSNKLKIQQIQASLLKETEDFNNDELWNYFPNVRQTSEHNDYDAPPSSLEAH